MAAAIAPAYACFPFGLVFLLLLENVLTVKDSAHHPTHTHRHTLMKVENV